VYAVGIDWYVIAAISKLLKIILDVLKKIKKLGIVLFGSVGFSFQFFVKL